MPALSFLDARTTVLREVRSRLRFPAVESIPLAQAPGRVLAEDIAADRDAPPFDRAMRDGFAVRDTEIPGTLRVTGEVRAGEIFEASPGSGPHKNGEAVEIMTGAPVPPGFNAVVMVEHCTRHPNGAISTDKALPPDANIARRGCEASRGQILARPGQRIDYATVSLLASNGFATVQVYEKPRVAILSTGDEIVAIDQQPAPHQIRNSNAWSLAAQVERAGGIPLVLPVAPDLRAETLRLIEECLQQADLLLLSGGVSAGKYDVVEPALADLGAEFFFDRVLIQPGAPLVFGHTRGKFFFGLPGNPGSTMVTFELFARAALDLLSGASEAPLPITLAKLTQPFRHKSGLTRFLPATLSCLEITPVDWQGSGDVPSLSRANAFLVAEPDHPEYAAGDLIGVLLK